MAKYKLHPQARKKYLDSVKYYAIKHRELSTRFVSVVKSVISQIARQPDFFGWFDEEFRKAVLQKFLFSVIYRINPDDTILIVAAAHASREPGYWKDRV